MIRTAAVVALLLFGRPAAAGEPATPRGSLQDGEHNYQIAIASGWRPVDAPGGTLLAYEGPGKTGHLAITRVDIGRVGKREQPRMIDEIERGVEKSTRSYKRIKRSVSTSGIVPVLDLVYQRSAAGGHTLMRNRFLLFRRHTVVLSIGVDPAAREARRAAEAMVDSFTPFLP